MIAEQLTTLCRSIGQWEALVWQGQVYTSHQLAATADRLAGALVGFGGQRVGVAIRDVAAQLTALLALDRIGSTAVLLSATTNADTLQQLRDELELAEFLSDLPGMDRPLQEYLEMLPSPIGRGAGGEGSLDRNTKIRSSVPNGPHPNPLPKGEGTMPPDSSHEGSLVLFTSGTSGPPKPAVHTWRSLASAVNYKEPFRGRCWLLGYDPAKFAGLQVILQALLTGGRLAVPDDSTPEAGGRCLVEQQVEFASGTPTYWRMLLQGSRREDLARAALKQITLGGEPADQGLLDALRETFPQARIAQVYASTEMGTCFSVRDGKAGFPVSYLEEGAQPCRLRIAEDGELCIQSARAMSGYLGESKKEAAWFATGDLVEIRGQRALFIGRKSDAINVGGNKVFPAQVEEVIRAVPGVVDVLVSGMKSSLVGQLVVADVRAGLEVDRESLRKEILLRCRRQLAKYKVPAQIRFCDRLSITAAGKLSRSNS